MLSSASLAAVSQLPNRPPRPVKLTALSERPSDALWIEPVARLAVVVFFGLLVLDVAVPQVAGRVFWTVAVASLPLLFVIAGYHRWRRICPLAWIAQIPTRLGLAGHRRAGPWLQAHGYDVVVALLVFSLWLRLVATNGDGRALAAFLILLSASAVAVGFAFTGKTWCNYVCPVSFVEKLYTEPRGLRDTPNSQCATCTACKPACPDINEENSYWKEILAPAKARAYYAFPGVVLAFYAYYYLQAGTWAYYFDGSWTNQAGLIRTAFLPGHDAMTAGFFFLPAVPRAVAAAVTLAGGAAISLLTLSAVEPRLGAALRTHGVAIDAAGLRSTMFTIAAFIAFVSFYSFAGAPTLRLVPGLPHIFQLLVVATATLFLVRRIGRRQGAFTEETLARKIIANWKWDDIAPPRNLREAFLIHTVRSQSHEEGRKRLLDLYKQSVRDSLQSGVVSRVEVHRLESLRNQMGIASTDHERVMAELADEEGGLAASDARLTSPEKQLQLETYAAALAVHLERQRASDRPTDDAFVRDLRNSTEVTAEEHGAVLDGLLRRQDGVGAHLADVPATIEWAAEAVNALTPARSSVSRFLVKLLRRRWSRAADSLAQALGSDGDATAPTVAGLISPTHRCARRPCRPSAHGCLHRLAHALPAPSQRHARTWAPRQRCHVYCERSSRARIRTFAPRRCTSGLHGPGDRSRPPPSRRRRASGGTRDCVATPGRHDPRHGRLDRDHPREDDRPGADWTFRRPRPRGSGRARARGHRALVSTAGADCRAGETGDEAFVILDGEVSVLHPDGRVAYVEGSGACIGELAVIDPAPREATVVASTVAVRALCLTGASLRRALNASPAMSEGIIRILARRLRRAIPTNVPVLPVNLGGGERP